MNKTVYLVVGPGDYIIAVISLNHPRYPLKEVDSINRGETIETKSTQLIKNKNIIL